MSTHDHLSDAPDEGVRIVDAHDDLLLEVAFRSFRRGEPSAFGSHWLPHLRDGRVALQVCALYADLATLPEAALRAVLTLIASFERLLGENDGEVVAVTTREELAQVESGERIGLMLALEGAEPLVYGPWLADVFWRPACA